MALTWKHGGLIGLVLVGLASWFAWPSSNSIPSSRSATHHVALEADANEDAAILTTSHSPPKPAPTEHTTRDAKHLESHQEQGEHPHPITPEHERIFEENRTIQALNDSMARRDVSRMRELLSEYHRLDPQDVEATQAGYLVIADCIEYPGSTSLAAASHFYDTQRHSPLRRFVRRICFENAD